MNYQQKLLNNAISNITIDQIDVRDIYDQAMRYHYHKPVVEVNESTIQRLMVNVIRHDHTNYENYLKKIHKLRKCKKELSYSIYKNEILREIANQYPSLSEECNHQKNMVQMVKVIR